MQISGELVTSAQRRDPFLQLSQELWSSGVEAASSASDSARFGKGGIRGTWTWPFSVTLPQSVEIKRDGQSHNYQLPGSFISKQSNYTVLYKLSTSIVAGKFVPDYVYVPLKFFSVSHLTTIYRNS